MARATIPISFNVEPPHHVCMADIFSALGDDVSRIGLGCIDFIHTDPDFDCRDKIITISNRHPNTNIRRWDSRTNMVSNWTGLYGCTTQTSVSIGSIDDTVVFTKLNIQDIIEVQFTDSSGRIEFDKPYTIIFYAVDLTQDVGPIPVLDCRSYQNGALLENEMYGHRLYLNICEENIYSIDEVRDFLTCTGEFIISCYDTTEFCVCTTSGRAETFMYSGPVSAFAEVVTVKNITLELDLKINKLYLSSRIMNLSP